ncbi:MAG: hypothetical protein U5K56_07025 [Halioglobus sp.]|nr:hypothetical protein [Halioglobus sp.]
MTTTNGLPVNLSEKLRDSWRIVLVATPDTAGGLAGTLEDVRARSVSGHIEVLAVDHPAVRETLRAVTLPVHYALTDTPDNYSHWTDLLSCFAMSEEPVVFLLAGCRVPAHWDARLVAAAQRSGAAAVAPLCVRHPVLSVLFKRRRPPGLSVDEMDQWLNDYAAGAEFPVPFMLQSCLQGDYWAKAAAAARTMSNWWRGCAAAARTSSPPDGLYIDDFHTNCDTGLEFLPGPTGMPFWTARR